MASPQIGNVLQQYSCRCHNITISACDRGSTPLPSQVATGYQHVFVGEDGIHINHHCLTLRTRDRAQELQSSSHKLLQHLTLSCLACKTTTYRVAQEISRGNEAREGPVIPTEEWVEQETLLSKSGWIEVFVGLGGCLVGTLAIEEHMKSLQPSRSFSIGIPSSLDTPRPSSTESTTTLQPCLRPSTDDSTKPFPLHTQLLPSLPPLFPPPPFTPSHPVFLSLAAVSTAKSTDLRQQAEEETRAFAMAKLDALKVEEAQLRKELEGIWRAYREGWKEVLGRVNEERRRSLPPKSDSSTPTSSAKSGFPMSIRDFSPIVRSQTQVERLPTMSPSTSLLSTSRIQTGSHLPTPTRSPVPDPIVPESGAQNSTSASHNISTVPSSRANGNRHLVSSSTSTRQSYDDGHYSGAFKRNMDTNVDIARSMAWLQGQEEMRRRLGGREDDEPKDRARKRTSKNLGIGAVEAQSAPPTEQTDLAPKGEVQNIPKSRKQLTGSVLGNPTLGKTNGSSPGNRVEPGQMDSGSISKAKRRVTFDVHPEAVVHKAASTQRNEPDAEIELFDLDDLSWDEETDGQHSSRPVQPRPVVRTSSYKLRPNEGASALHGASLPVRHPLSQTNGYTNWIGGSARRSVVLADALPMLSSSVPASDRVLTRRSLEISTREEQPALTSETSSPTLNGKTASLTHEASPVGPLSTIEYAETELKTLLAASAPSHRHAWKEGGRAWEMFYQRAKDKKKNAKGVIVEEGSDRASSGLDDDSDASSGESPTNSTWRNPSQYASSLPMQIRPLTQYKPPLEAKTSLTDKHGVLVPPLKVTNSRLNSAAAIRRAAYAERDRTRSIDPGPTLDFNEQEEIEDEDASQDINDGERGRHHALSILQARSIIPEAGMWRSMTS